MALQFWSLYNQQNTYEKEQLLLVHQSKNSILAHQKGNQLHIFTTDSISSKNFGTDFQIEERIEIMEYHSISDAYQFNNQKILVLDSLGIYSHDALPVDYIVITQSPKLNLERLINTLNPKILIADGSNYHSDIKRWEKTCATNNLPFHYTGDKGAFELKLE